MVGVQRDNVIRVLGPIDVAGPDGPRSAGGRHARILLGVLVLAGGRSVPVETLQAAMWGDVLPQSPESSLQTYVWRLRRVLGADAITSIDHSYVLDVRRDQVDALQFEDLLLAATDVRAEPARCSTLCREALALWRGPPFGDLADDDAFRLEAMRLDELRLTTVELFLEAEVELGHHEIAVAELECAVREHPYRERMWYLLIDALRRDDRRVEALRACHRLRSTLGELGVEPGEHVQSLEVELLDL